MRCARSPRPSPNDGRAPPPLPHRRLDRDRSAPHDRSRDIWLLPELLTLPRFWGKIGLVAAAIVLGAVHDFVLGPRASRADAPPSMRPAASWLARINVLLVVTVVYLGLSFR